MPSVMARKDFNFGNPKSDATSDPVQAPVPGKGMRTKSKSPKKAHFGIAEEAAESFSLIELSLVSDTSSALSSVTEPILSLFFIALPLTRRTMGRNVLKRSIMSST